MASPVGSGRPHQTELSPEAPGPGLRLSDLNPPTPAPGSDMAHLPPRRLQPIAASPASSRKKKKTRKKHQGGQGVARSSGHVQAPQLMGDGEAPSLPPSTDDDGSLMGRAALSSLRSRLDPIYNPPSPTPLPDLTPGHAPTSAPVPPIDLKGIQQDQGNHMTVPDGKARKRTKRRTAKGRISDKKPEGDGMDSSHFDGAPEPSSGDDAHTSGRGKRRSRRRGSEVDGIRGEAEGTGGSVEEGDLEGERSVGEEGGETTLVHLTGRQLPVFPGDLEAGMEPIAPPDLGEVGGELVQGQRQHQSTSGLSRPRNPHFFVSEEDIVEGEGVEEEGVLAITALPLVPSTTQHLNSQTKEVIFVERADGRGFVTQKRATGGGRGSAPGDVEGGTVTEREISSAGFALHAHKAIQTLFLSAHGLVAGISLWDAVVSNVLSRQSNEHIDLLQYYNPLTLPVHAVYVFLLPLVLLSLLDRFDFVRLDKMCFDIFIKSPSQVLLLLSTALIFLALVLTLSVAAIDERIELYPDQPSLWTDVLTAVNTSSLTPNDTLPSPTTHALGATVYVPREEDPTSSLLGAWLALAIVRTVCCCGSWMMVVWLTSHDRLEDYLHTMASRPSDSADQQR